MLGRSIAQNTPAWRKLDGKDEEEGDNDCDDDKRNNSNSTTKV